MPPHAPQRGTAWLRRTGVLITSLTAVTGLSTLSPGSPAVAVAAEACTPTAASLVPVVRLDVGGRGVTTGGKTWLPDAGATGGTASTVSSPTDIAGTTADPLYRSERWGSFSYDLAVPAAGRYVTRLHFAELWFGVDGRAGGRGSRIFSVNVEGGSEELQGFDITAAVGSSTATVKSYTTAVSDGRLSISTRATANAPQLAALEVLRQVPAVVCPPATPTAPTPGPVTLGADSGRPFAPTSAWNTALPVNPVLDPKSAAMITSVTPSGRAYANIYAYGDPVFTATAGTATARVDCTMPWGTCDLEGKDVRIPADARPTTGTDGRMIVVDLAARTSCDFWQARKVSATSWTTSWGTCASLDGDGRGPSGGATGGGVNTLTGVVRTFEMRNLSIPHALSLATNNSCRTVFRFPATKTDGSSSRTDCIPEGARLQLDPSIDVNALPGITPGEKAVARALQTYGAINRDNSGSPLSMSFEAPIGEADPYPAVGFGWDYYDMPHIPWKRLRVLRQWDGR